MIYNHHSSATHSPNFISVHLQAIFVAIITAHCSQAFETTSASFSCCFAFKTLCLIHFFVSKLDKYSDLSTETVQTSIGLQVA
jgi:hypothetical protein